MSFGIKDLKKKNVDHYQHATRKFVPHVVVGDDIYSVLYFLKLRREIKPELVTLISSKVLDRNALVEEIQNQVSLLRSADDLKDIYTNNPNFKAIQLLGESQFYKDGEFKEFGGRAKPFEILSGEEFFIQKAYCVEAQSMFHPEDWQNLDEILKQEQMVLPLTGIEKTEPTDLVENVYWRLSFKNFSVIEAEYLYWGKNLKFFENKLVHKEKHSKDLMSLCSNAKLMQTINVHFELKNNSFGEPRTLFIPQSMTHEWGHFIVDVLHDNKVNLLFFIREEEFQTEEVASKVKLAKRVLERVFPNFEKDFINESIYYSDEYFSFPHDQALIEAISFDYSQLSFIGINKTTKQYQSPFSRGVV